LRALRRDIAVTGIRGNVDTRLRKVESGEVDAVVMAAAALARMGWLDKAAEVLSFDLMLPAPGQGALAVEIRSNDEAIREMAAAIDDGDFHRAVTAERAFLARLGGGCSVPIAALGAIDGGRLRLRGLVGDAPGTRILRAELEGPANDAEALGIRLAEELLSQGAADLLKETP
jgi:hydroxymethylbilane synthase